MKKFKLVRKPTLIEVLLSLIILGMLVFNSWDYLTTFGQMQAKERDAARISDVGQIQAALMQYYSNHNNNYPACLYKTAACASLEGSTEMPVVPRDTETGFKYSYAAYGAGAVCSGYHLGTSLERTASQALLTGADAIPEPSSKLCDGSAPDFSGLSFEKGGQPCSLKVGTPQPTDAADGETCYDVTRHRPINN